MLPRLPRKVVAAMALTAIAVLAGFASIHMRLVKSFPAEDQVLTETPDHIRLWFSQNPELALSRVRLTGSGDEIFELGKAQATDAAKSFMVPITDTLPQGSYTITWQTASPDGHNVRGNYAFRFSTTESSAEGDDDSGGLQR
jgi:methionine-rich copper-binding protein CopC